MFHTFSRLQGKLQRTKLLGDKLQKPLQLPFVFQRDTIFRNLSRKFYGVAPDTVHTPRLHTPQSFSGCDTLCNKRTKCCWLRNMYSRFIFKCREPSCLSDHSPVVNWLNINTNICNPDALSESDALIRLPKQFFWENDSTQKFIDTL